MASNLCPSCGKLISGLEPECPHCGAEKRYTAKESDLFHAASKGDFAAANRLLADGVRPNTDALFIATVKGDVAIVRILLERGANAKAKDKHGQTLLQLATAEGHAEVVDALKAAGATG